MADHIQIGDISPRIQYVGDAVQTVFTYPFPIFVDADMEVYEDTTLKIPSTDYTVSGGGSSSGGTVTFMIAPAAGVAVTLKRNVAIARTSDFQESGEFRAKVINDELDILTALLQQVDEQSGRSLRLGPTDSVATTFIPARADRAGRFLGFDAGGEPIASAGSVDTLAVSTFMATLLDDTDAAAVRATLGLAIGADVLAPTGNGSGLTGIVTGATAAERANIALNAFRIAVNGGLSVQNMADGVVDEFTDETGIDTVASTNEIYDPTGDYYSNKAADSTEDGGYAANSSYNIAQTWVDRTWAVNNGATVTKIAFYNSQATTGTCTVKIFLENSTTSFDVVVSESFAFDGSGWQIFTLATPYAVPATGTYRAGVYTPAVTYTVQSATVAMSIKAGDVAGVPETGFTAGSYNPPHVRVYYQGPVADFALQSNAAAALAQPDSAFLVLWHEPVDAVTLNTDVQAHVSRDGGTTWTQASLALAAALSGNEQILTGSADLSAQPAGASIKWKVVTSNSKQQRLRGVSEQWS